MEEQDPCTPGHASSAASGAPASATPESLAGHAAQTPVTAGIEAGTAVLGTAISAVQLGLEIQKSTQPATSPTVAYVEQVIAFRNHRRPPTPEGDEQPGIVMYVRSYSTSDCTMGETFVLLRPGESDAFTLFVNPNASEPPQVTFNLRFYTRIKTPAIDQVLKTEVSLTLAYDPTNDTGWYLDPGSESWTSGKIRLNYVRGELFVLGSATLGGVSCVDLVPSRWEVAFQST